MLTLLWAARGGDRRLGASSCTSSGCRGSSWGPWYQVLITNFVLLSLVFLLGLWFGLIYRRLGTIGAVVFCAGLAVLLVAAG